MKIHEDEALKGACHGLVAGCLLPVIAYNLARGKKANTLIYLLFLGFEIAQVAGHVKDLHKS